MDRHIFLVGMPGSGKSALGRRVASKLQIPYLDTDVYLTETTGMDTAQLYQYFGEQAFRDGETRLLQKLAGAVPGIISTGGGVCLRECNRRLMKNHGIIVLIDRPIESGLCWPRRAGKRSNASITNGCLFTGQPPMWSWTTATDFTMVWPVWKRLYANMRKGRVRLLS